MQVGMEEASNTIIKSSEYDPKLHHEVRHQFWSFSLVSLWPGVVVPFTVLSMNQIDLFKISSVLEYLKPYNSVRTNDYYVEILTSDLILVII